MGKIAMRLCGLVLLAVLIGAAWRPAYAYSHQGVVDAMRALQQGRDGSGEIAKRPKLDVNRYFEILTHLSLEEGMVLDYVIFSDGMGGGPVLYVRPAEKAPFASYEEFEARKGAKARQDYLQQVRVDDSETGFFELAVLAVMGNQFDLIWHSNYNDVAIVCTTEALERLLATPTEFGQPIPEKIRTAARDVDTTPRVEMSGEKVRVHLTCFTKWGGVMRCTFNIERAFPHTIEKVDRETLVPYFCGVLF